jgi:hypothetical protein
MGDVAAPHMPRSPQQFDKTGALAFIAKFQNENPATVGIDALQKALNANGFAVDRYMYGNTPSNNEFNLGGEKWKVIGGEGSPTSAYWYKPGMNDSPGGGNTVLGQGADLSGIGRNRPPGAAERRHRGPARHSARRECRRHLRRGVSRGAAAAEEGGGRRAQVDHPRRVQWRDTDHETRDGVGLLMAFGHHVRAAYLRQSELTEAEREERRAYWRWKQSIGRNGGPQNRLSVWKPTTPPRATHIAGYVPPKGSVAFSLLGRVVLPLQGLGI